MAEGRPVWHHLVIDAEQLDAVVDRHSRGTMEPAAQASSRPLPPRGGLGCKAVLPCSEGLSQLRRAAEKRRFANAELKCRLVDSANCYVYHKLVAGARCV